MATAAAPGVVLCVADGIVRIVVHVVTGEDLGGRPRREIDFLIGVAAGEDKRSTATETRNRTAASQPIGALASGVNVQEKSAIRFSYSLGVPSSVRSTRI